MCGYLKTGAPTLYIKQKFLYFSFDASDVISPCLVGISTRCCIDWQISGIFNHRPNCLFNSVV